MKDREECPHISIPLNTIKCLKPHAYGCTCDSLCLVMSWGIGSREVCLLCNGSSRRKLVLMARQSPALLTRHLTSRLRRSIPDFQAVPGPRHHGRFVSLRDGALSVMTLPWVSLYLPLAIDPRLHCRNFHRFSVLQSAGPYRQSL